VWVKSPGLIEERIYLGGFEIFRSHSPGVAGNIDASTATLERETLHVMDDKQRVALVETRTLDVPGTDTADRQLIRYQLGNHLGSAVVELDDDAEIISYEEYTPYGCSSYQAVRSQTEARKRYRYTGKERDEESGFYYHGARYYAAWLGRWTQCDPAGLADGPNIYGLARCSPINYVDSLGLAVDGFEELRPVAEATDKAGLAIGEQKPSGVQLKELPAAQQRMQTTPVDARHEANKGANRARTAANSPKQNPSGLGKTQPGDEMGHMAPSRENAKTAIPNDIANAKSNIKAIPAQGKAATVTRQDGTVYETDIHAAHEPKLDEINARAQAGTTPGTTKPQGTVQSSVAAQDAMQEAKILTEPMTREYTDTVKRGGPAKPEPGLRVDPKTGRVARPNQPGEPAVNMHTGAVIVMTILDQEREILQVRAQEIAEKPFERLTPEDREIMEEAGYELHLSAYTADFTWRTNPDYSGFDLHVLAGISLVRRTANRIGALFQ
jgi:RHS repeat-associated protein